MKTNIFLQEMQNTESYKLQVNASAIFAKRKIIFETNGKF